MYKQFNISNCYRTHCCNKSEGTICRMKSSPVEFHTYWTGLRYKYEVRCGILRISASSRTR